LGIISDSTKFHSAVPDDMHGMMEKLRTERNLAHHTLLNGATYLQCLQSIYIIASDLVVLAVYFYLVNEV